jgi:hypothetical protein
MEELLHGGSPMKKGRKKIEPIYKSPEQLINMGFQMTEEAKKELEGIIENEVGAAYGIEVISALAQAILSAGFIRKKDIQLDEEKMANIIFCSAQGSREIAHALVQKGEQIIKT